MLNSRVCGARLRGISVDVLQFLLCGRDLGDVVGLEGAVGRSGAGWEGFGGELLDVVVADHDAGLVLFVRFPVSICRMLGVEGISLAYAVCGQWLIAPFAGVELAGGRVCVAGD